MKESSDMNFVLNQGSQRPHPEDSQQTQWFEKRFAEASGELKLGIFNDGLYIGSVYFKGLDKGNVDVYIPSVPESRLTQIGPVMFNLDFGEIPARSVTGIPTKKPDDLL